MMQSVKKEKFLRKTAFINRAYLSEETHVCFDCMHFAFFLIYVEKDFACKYA